MCVYVYIYVCVYNPTQIHVYVYVDTQVNVSVLADLLVKCLVYIQDIDYQRMTQYKTKYITVQDIVYHSTRQSVWYIQDIV